MYMCMYVCLPYSSRSNKFKCFCLYRIPKSSLIHVKMNNLPLKINPRNDDHYKLESLIFTLELNAEESYSFLKASHNVLCSQYKLI